MHLLNRSMEDLPDDVTTDILSRLPVKMIIYSKCVCKKWLHLLSVSYFDTLHLSRSPPGLMIHQEIIKKEMASNSHKPGILKWVEVEDEPDHHILYQDHVMSLDLNLVPPLQDSEIRIVGSVNGLICMLQYGPTSKNTYICNPFTREYIILPTQHYHTKRYVITGQCFGVTSLTREYKVIWIIEDSTSTVASKAEVYTLGKGQCTSLGPVPFLLIDFNGPFLNGHAHWTVCGGQEKLCAFDFDNETFKMFPSPPPVETRQESDYDIQSLGVLKGCLCLCDTFESLFTIWVMKEYGVKKSWHKELVIKEGVSLDLDFLTRELVYVIEGLKEGTILMGYDEKLAAFSPKRRTVTDTQLTDPYFHGMPYIPSFLKLQNFEPERVYVF